MVYRVRQTAQADSELDAILEWLLAQGAGSAAISWIDLLQETVQTLSRLPHRCPLALEDAEFPYEVRQLVYGRKPHQYRSCSRSNMIQWLFSTSTRTATAVASSAEGVA